MDPRLGRGGKLIKKRVYGSLKSSSINNPCDRIPTKLELSGKAKIQDIIFHSIQVAGDAICYKS